METSIETKRPKIDLEFILVLAAFLEQEEHSRQGYFSYTPLYDIVMRGQDYVKTNTVLKGYYEDRSDPDHLRNNNISIHPRVFRDGEKKELRMIIPFRKGGNKAPFPLEGEIDLPSEEDRKDLQKVFPQYDIIWVKADWSYDW